VTHSVRALYIDGVRIAEKPQRRLLLFITAGQDEFLAAARMTGCCLASRQMADYSMLFLRQDLCDAQNHNDEHSTRVYSLVSDSCSAEWLLCSDLLTYLLTTDVCVVSHKHVVQSCPPVDWNCQTWISRTKMRGGNCGTNFCGQLRPHLLQLEAVFMLSCAKLKCIGLLFNLFCFLQFLL